MIENDNIQDVVPVHSVPDKSWSEDEIKKWLEEENILIMSSFSKIEMLDLVKEYLDKKNV